MKFEWDTAKEKINKRKHKLSFSDACYIFTDKHMLTLFDPDHSAHEERWVTMGQARNGKIIIVVHTYCEEDNGEERVRIISARKATKREADQYVKRRGRM
jgi:uncharacterized protein